MKIYKKLIGLCSLVCLVVCSFSAMTMAAEPDTTQYWPQGPEIVSLSGIVMEVNTGTVLYEKNSHDVHYPASITKIMTALLSVENSKMGEIVTFSHDSVYKTEGSGIARDVGEKMTMEQCLYGLMLASANECAYAVGEHVTDGDINKFVQMMNERASALGCTNTHFNNSSGLPDEQHYTSAYDMALIASEAYKNETFRIICGTKTYTIPFTNKHKDEETYLQNHHQMLYPLKTRKYLYDYCMGGKTGYTVAANNTLVTYAEKDGMTLACVVLNAPAGSHYEDTRALFDFCFDNFKMVNVAENETSYGQESIEEKGRVGNYEPFVDLDVTDHIVLPVMAEFKDTKSEIVYDNEEEEVLGVIKYTYADRPVGGADIKATNATVESLQFFNSQSTDETMEADENTPKKEPVLEINVKMILFVLLAIIGLVLLLYFGWKFIDKFYIIRHKLNLYRKEKSPYKTISINKIYRKRHRKWF